MAPEPVKHASEPAAIPAQNLNRHPVGLWFFFWGEFAERCSYYGMRAILFLYMTQVIRHSTTDELYSTTEATPLFSAFKMACYFLPLLGGWIADRWLGRYWTIVGFSVPYVLGHFILGIPTEVALLIALILLAGGSGVIKPNISTLMGQTYDQLRPGNERLRSAAFMWFYFAINVGAVISQFAMPEIRQQYILSHITPELRDQVRQMLARGENITEAVPRQIIADAYALAFQFPAWLMVVSLIIFAAGKKFYAIEVKTDHHELTPEERRLQWQTLWRLFGIFALVVLFWTGYEHNDSLWTAFNRDYVDMRVPFRSDPISPDQLAFLNPLFVIILVPTFNILFGWLDPQLKIFTPMRRVLAGFVLTAAAVGIMAIAGFMVQGHIPQLAPSARAIEATAKVSILWPTMAYVVLTVGEVLLYGTMLELAYAAAPKGMKGFITACFLLTNTLGNFINIAWTRMYGGALTDAPEKRGDLLPGTFFAITAALVLAAAIAFVFIGKRFERAQKEQAQAGLA